MSAIDSINTSSEPTFTVAGFIAVCNQILEYSFPNVIIEGEVASFKVNQGKWVFFDLKEDEFTVNCFMPVNQLTAPISDGMKIQVRAIPKLTRWGKFSLTVQKVLPLGAGNIKKSFELLKRKLTAEGLFDPTKKRPLPSDLTKIGVISSTAAAGYRDFLKIIDNRWGGIKIFTINTLVQGISAPEQITRALDAFNQRGEVEVIVILRGGGSADDLSAFNDEQLVRAIATSRIPVLTGIGHEVDESLADLAADVRASTPSNAAEILVPDRSAMNIHLMNIKTQIQREFDHQITTVRDKIYHQMNNNFQEIQHHIDLKLQSLSETVKILHSFDPNAVLQRGYAILRSDSRTAHNFVPGETISITTHQQILTAEVTNAQKRNQ